MANTISVVIIAKNEEKRIEDCIKSVVGWANEIIVVDDESTDRTRDIATKLGAKVFLRKMEIEGAHRNWAHQQASSDWIFSLDADERLTPELKREITESLANNTQDYSLFTVPRRNFIGDYWIRWGGLYPAAQLKLFKKGIFKWEEVEVHPRAFSEGKCGHLKSDLIHYTYKDWGDYLRKLNNQTTLEAKKWYKVFLENPKKANKKMSKFNIVWRTGDRFMRCYISKKAYRDGFIGFMVAYFSSLYQVVSYAKYQELKKK